MGEVLKGVADKKPPRSDSFAEMLRDIGYRHLLLPAVRTKLARPFRELVE
jgi:hypothetical protein